MLTGNRIDFDYGEEDIMARHAYAENGTLHIGSCAYGKVLVAGVDTLRSSTLRLLTDYAAQGGALILQEIPPPSWTLSPPGRSKP